MTEKSDVYSFRVVLMELLCAQTKMFWTRGFGKTYMGVLPSRGEEIAVAVAKKSQ